MRIRDIRPEDAAACGEIYNYYILNTTFTLEKDPLTPQTFLERVETIRSRYPYLVAEEDGEILGYVYLSPFSLRYGYRYTADLSIYLRQDTGGKGIGRALYAAALERGKEMGLRDVMAIVTEENTGSLAFHKAMGFTEVGRFPGVADKFSRRFGVIYFQKNIG